MASLLMNSANLPEFYNRVRKPALLSLRTISSILTRRKKDTECRQEQSEMISDQEYEKAGEGTFNTSLLPKCLKGKEIRSPLS